MILFFKVRIWMSVFSLKAQTDLGFEDRLSMEGSLVFLDQVKGADAGQFKVTDILGFPVSIIQLEVQRKDGLGWERTD